ncbi:MAG: DHH family phosphoesterase [Thermoflexibacteraceae bacterium]
MEQLDGLKGLLESPKKIVITTHQKPDADALGSSLGLRGYLKKLNHEVKVITPTDYPQFIQWMSGNEDVLVYDKTKTHETAEAYFLAADIIFCLDFSELKRVEPLDEMVRKSKAKVVLIDHHHGYNGFADFSLWNVSAAATAELIYQFINIMGHRHLIDVPSAECIYAGIVTDTGSFKFESTSSKLHREVADLIDLGVLPNKIQRLIYDNNTENRLRFLGYALQNKLQILWQYRTAYFVINQEEQQKFSTQTGDTEGLVNYALSLAGIRMATILIEKPDKTVKMSFRSFGNLAVNEIARLHFEGGGHRNAAGGRSAKDLLATEQEFLRVLELHKEELVKD